MQTPIKAPIAEPFYYRTTERGVAAALMALGYELLDVDRRAGQDPLFTFPGSTMLLGAVEAYWQDNLAISAKRLATAMKYLDDIIREQGSLAELDVSEP